MMDNHEELQWHTLTTQDAISVALENERRRLADRIDSGITGQINLILAQLNAYQQTAIGTEQMAFAVLATMLRDLLQQARDLEASLNPSVLMTLGLEPALESFVQQKQRTSGMAMTFTPAYLRERLPHHLELVLYRIVQEQVDDAIIRARASTMTIILEKDADGLTCTITHNGKRSDDQAQNRLMLSLKARLALFGGSVDHASGAYQGIQLVLTIPLQTPVELTDREMDVIRLLVDGQTTKEIALALDIRPRTVKFHLDNIYSKLGVNTRTEAAIYALRHGWVRMTDAP